MPILSFGWTAAPFVARQKFVTRRDWRRRQAEMFMRAYDRQDMVRAWNKVPFAGGRRIGMLRLSERPYLEPLSEMPDEDFRFEGFEWLGQHLYMVPPSARKNPWAACTMDAFNNWRNSRAEMWVIRFEPVEIEKWAVEWLVESLAKKEPAVINR